MKTGQKLFEAKTKRAEAEVLTQILNLKANLGVKIPPYLLEMCFTAVTYPKRSGQIHSIVNHLLTSEETRLIRRPNFLRSKNEGSKGC